jgi:peptidoglycan/xylan/chitin deacetylase (PgdA/CDA1 family)
VLAVLGVVLRSAYYTGLRALALPVLMRRVRQAGVILCYHNVRSDRDGAATGDAGSHLPLDRFAEQMGWLARHYQVVPLHELVERLHANRPLRGLAALTFDDGYAGVFEHAWPLLLDLGLPATVFIVADAPDAGAAFWWDHPGVARSTTQATRERWLTELRGDRAGIVASLGETAVPELPRSERPADWALIARAVDSGLALGVHSASHRTLTELDDAELEGEIVASWETIRSRTGVRPEFFAYPYGRWDARARDTVRAAGYRGGVTLDYALVRGDTDPWALPRVNVPASISGAAFEAWVAGLSPRRGRAA